MAVLNVVTPPSSFVLLEYFNPLVEGNEWHYTGTDYDGQPSTRVDRVASRNYPVTAYTGRGTPRTYTTNLVRLNRAYGSPTYDDWDDLFSDHGALAFWGYDDGSDSGRVDGGLVLPPSLNLGQSASVTRDYYDRGVYQGSVTFKLTAVSWGSVTVPAGTFEDCLKVRIVISGGGESETQDEWWVRGVGAVKHRNAPDNGEEQLDLISYSVVAPVRIVTPPRAQTNSLGGVATFSVIASGSAPLSYQWRKNGVDLADDARISGATSNILVIAGLEFADAGSYSVRVANGHDSAVSAAAQLVVADKLSPVLAITSHTELQLLGGAATVLAGTASDAGLGDNGIASVTVNGLRATNDTVAGTGTAQWSRAMNLTLGTNRLTIVARDGQGNATTNFLRLLADTARPALTFTAPKLNQRWSNSVFTVTGKATDNLGVTEVRYQLNELDWAAPTTSPSGWSNWTAQVVLTPGTNTLRAYALDVAGNRSLTNTVKFVYVLTAPLGLEIVGNGKVNGGANGKLFELGKPVALTVTPATGWVLTNWLVQVEGNTIRSTNKAVPFLMASNTVVTATFVDVAKPVLTITAPKLNQRWSNEVFTVAGKVTDNNTNGSVWYQLNGGDWTSASGWTNWSASVNLIPGANNVKAYAVDAAGNRSTTNSANFVRVLTAPLGVVIIGKGKVNGVTDGQLLEIGKSVSPTVTPATGWILTNWLVTVEGNTIRSTNKAVPFLMASNTVVTATFVDVAKPVLTITAPKLNQRWSNEVFTVAGKVTDNNPSGSVWYQLNGGDWTSASGWTNWSASVNLIPGTNHVRAYAVDAAGNRSTTNSVNVIYVLTYCLADYFYSAPLGSRLIYDGLDWDGFPAQQKIEIKDADHPLVTYSGTAIVSNYVVNVLHIESAYGTYISGTGQFFSYDDWDEYFIMGGCSFGWVGSDDDDETLRVDRGFLITNRVAVGQTISITRGIYLDGSYAGQATFKLQLLDVSTVTVPAGTFPGCLRVRLTLSAGGESQTHDDWLAPGIGMVKQQGVSGDGAAERWELIRYEPPAPAPAPLVVNVAPVTQMPLQWMLPDDGSAMADGQMQWRVAGPAGQAFVVEGSSDLRDWMPVHTNTIPAEGLLLSIPVGPQPAQFFRLRAVQP